MLKIGGRMLCARGLADYAGDLSQRVTDGACRQETLFETCLPLLAHAPVASQFEF